MSYTNGPKIVTDGLVLCLDAGNNKSYPSSGTSWSDLSGNNNNGTLTNGPTFTGSFGGSIVFDGSNDYATNVYSQPAYQSTTSFTWNVWVKPTSAATGTIIGNRGGGSLDFTKLQNQGYEYYPLTLSYAMTLNVWQNACVVKNQSSFYYYINGILVNSGTSSVTRGANPLYLGGDPGASEYAPNSIASVQIYNRPLSASEVLQNYNATKGRFGL